MHAKTRALLNAVIADSHFFSENISGADLVTQLFGKAPEEFLSLHTAQDLLVIARKSFDLLVTFSSTNSQFELSVETTQEGTALYVVLRDRPFIINTVSECIREHGAEIQFFLHPIPRVGDHALSLCYVEFSPLPESRIHTLTGALQSALSSLITVTDDFTPMTLRAESLCQTLDTLTLQSNISQGESRELAELLHAFTDGGFIFLGYTEWEAIKNSVPLTSLGLFKDSLEHSSSFLGEAAEDARNLENRKELFSITKTFTRSVVHRSIRVLLLTVREWDAQGSTTRIHTFLGMLSSTLRSRESFYVPVVRRKLSHILESTDVSPNMYLYKSIVNQIDHMPKDDALRFDISVLSEVVFKTLPVHSKLLTRCALLMDNAKRVISTLIIMPRDRFNTTMRKKLQSHVEEVLGAPKGSSEYLLDVSDKAVARFYFSTPSAPEAFGKIRVENLEHQLDLLTKTWVEILQDTLAIKERFEKEGFSTKYGEAFSETYQALTSPEEAIIDLETIETLSSEIPIAVRFSPSLNAQTADTSIAVYIRGESITVSKAVPIFENVGFEVIHERMLFVAPKDAPRIFIHRFAVRAKSSAQIDASLFEKVVAPGLVAMLRGDAPNDPLNLLMLGAGLDIRALSVLRTYSGFLSQINKFATRHSIYFALATTPELATLLWEVFRVKFDPAHLNSLTERKKRVAELLEDYRTGLSRVKDLSQDRILRGLGILLENSLRTNFFSSPHSIAIKLDSEKTDILPLPRPRFEIYVNGLTVEGIHLRSALVARGGLRWSDRKDDFRTEVLGLMKTQRTKNAVIVPSGSKGGFIVKNLPEDPTKQKPVVEAAYQDYIRALLSVTDNIVNGVVVHPLGMVIYDNDDPYLVVAADKGTATFSDLANRVAVEEFHFWLGDAFASGGSNGYDHKKYGITARGVWECVQRHFKEAGINYQDTPFTVVGIGDMSGDVFGNGLLLSRKMKLIAAFDHRSIFIDPDPDLERSYDERQRLFTTKGTTWSDYHKDLISTGGGIYARFEKEIPLSQEARRALSISDDVPAVLNGEQVITHILRAKVDLLWNGGIGTYVKASTEAHSDVNDSSNDRVRINAEELRVRVVGEGGNLGFTQKARCEFAHQGGFINTDAIDNSAGVDLSDHEVNLKILFSKIREEGALSFEERNEILKSMSNEVCDAVLAHNRSHALTLSLGVQRSKKNILYLKSLIKEMGKLGYLQRALEFLPDDEALDERAAKKEGLLRPELAVLMAVVKMWVKDQILPTALLKDPLLEEFLFEYFPPVLQQRYRAQIRAHTLAPHITASQVTNYIVDLIGISFFHRMRISYGVSAESGFTAVLAADAILGLRSLRQLIDRFDTVKGNTIFMGLSQELTRTLRAAASWLITTHSPAPSLSNLVSLYEKNFVLIAQNGDQIFGKDERAIYLAGISRYGALGLDTSSSRLFAAFPLVIPILEMLHAARLSPCEVIPVARAYAALLETLEMNQFVTLGQPIETHDRWENELRINAYEQIRHAITAIACELIRANILEPTAIRKRILTHALFEQLNTVLTEVREKGVTPAGLAIIAHKLQRFLPL